LKLTQIHLKNPSGLKLEVTNYGATLTRLQVPDKRGILTDVVVGLPKPEDYTTEAYKQYNLCLGATVGRYAGRISKGGFSIGKQFFDITHQDGVQLHGGVNALDKQLWTVDKVEEGETPFVIFSLKSNSGDNGYPGNLTLFAKYQLEKNTLKIEYTATTDAPTVINLTNHAYFNLDGCGSTKGNELYINASRYLEVDERLVPTGKVLAVEATPLDYTEKTQLHFKDHFGLDTPFVLDGGVVKASLYAKQSGIKMNVTTNQPAIVIFTPQDFGGVAIRDGGRFNAFPAICFECQNFPDAPNQPDFPSSLLLPGETYRNEMSYQFEVK
jgi:aldose 1-epimerase